MGGLALENHDIGVRPSPSNEVVPAPEKSSLAFLSRSIPFWAVLLVKVVVGSLVASHFLRDLFTPFLNYFVESGFANPWSHFQEMGRLDAFPYPPGMLIVFAIPRLLFSPMLSGEVDLVTPLHLLAMRLPLLLADLGTLIVLLRWFPSKKNLVLLLYWGSPIVFYASYCHGQLDMIPTALFLVSLYFVHAGRLLPSSLVFGLALGTKSHLLAALPFILIYLQQEKGMRGVLRYLLGAALVYGALILPVISDAAFFQMVYRNPEQLRLFAARLPWGLSGASFLVAPAVLFGMWFRFSSYPKWNWDLLMLYLGLLFSVFVLLSPPAPAYFLWSLPFVVFFLCRIPGASTGIYWCYVGAYILFFLLCGQNASVDEFSRLIPSLVKHLPSRYSDILFTLMEASLVGLACNMYVYGVRSNSVYSARSGPVMIGLAGDSGTGKDTFVGLLNEVLGKKQVTITSGDDYHRWPRGHSKWKDYTHLNPRGNNLHKEWEHAVALKKGKSVSRREYDHGTGQFTENRWVDPKGYLVFSGLHSLSLKSMRSLYDLKVFLDPEEDLRWNWKVKRDSVERKYTPEQIREAISKRETDRNRFILPQKEHADIIFRFQRVSEASDELKLEVQVVNSFNLIPLVEALENVSGLEVEFEPFLDPTWQKLTLSGKISSQYLQKICECEIPNLEEITKRPQFSEDLQGCVQLLFLNCLSQQLQLEV